MDKTVCPSCSENMKRKRNKIKGVYITVYECPSCKYEHIKDEHIESWERRYYGELL